jgi:hypothetical protein
MSLAEKFQITAPPAKASEPDESWTTFASARNTSCCMTPEASAKFNRMPKTQLHGVHEFVQATGGEFDVSGIKDPSVYSPAKGFIRREMNATDDQYGGEHIDLFYGEAKDELGNVGFVERNNYLDRM